MHFKIVKMSTRLISAASKNIRFRSTTTLIDDQAKFTTVDRDEVMKLGNFAQTWWDENGEMKALHSMNKLRVPLVRDCLINNKTAKPELSGTAQPLEGIKILDVGCGGGILSEPLARIGAQVVGLDPGKEVIEVAKDHAANDSSLCGKLQYICGSVEDHMLENYETYDAVVASEVIEHVTEQDRFVEACSSVLKPGGSIFFTTINRTMPAWVAGVMAAEHLLHLVPQNTHDWDKFVMPNELLYKLEKHDCYTRLVHGMLYNFICNEWFWTPNTSINYALHAVKKK